MGHSTHFNSLVCWALCCVCEGLGEGNTSPGQTLPLEAAGHCSMNSNNTFTVSVVLEPENFYLCFISI